MELKPIKHRLIVSLCWRIVHFHSASKLNRIWSVNSRTSFYTGAVFHQFFFSIRFWMYEWRSKDMFLIVFRLKFTFFGIDTRINYCVMATETTSECSKQDIRFYSEFTRENIIAPRDNQVKHSVYYCAFMSQQGIENVMGFAFEHQTVQSNDSLLVLFTVTNWFPNWIRFFMFVLFFAWKLTTTLLILFFQS